MLTYNSLTRREFENYFCYLTMNASVIRRIEFCLKIPDQFFRFLNVFF